MVGAAVGRTVGLAIGWPGTLGSGLGVTDDEGVGGMVMADSIGVGITGKHVGSCGTTAIDCDSLTYRRLPWSQ
jgi:hypothetical protein